MYQSNISLIIADDHQLFIQGMVKLLDEEPDIAIVGVANDGKELIQKLKAVQPDIVLMDINMPKMNGLDATQSIRSLFPSVKVIILSTYSEKHLVESARNKGASSYLLKNTDTAELLAAIRSVYEGVDVFPNEERKAEMSSLFQDPFLMQFNLTKREKEILRLIKFNHSNSQMAEKLSLSIYTIETHRKNIMQKLNLSSPGSLMKFIYENNI